MTKHILYIAFHFPPIQMSSGVHRTLAFSRYLAEHGDTVTVLTADKQAYQHYDEHNTQLIPDNINVITAYARDTARHFAVKQRYLRCMAWPDRWQSWIAGGIISGWRYIRKQKPDVIISTYPIASAHLIGYFLHKISGIPWIADLRDPMLQQNYPANPAIRRIFAWIERKMVKHCQHIIFTSPGALVLYRERYPQVKEDVWQVLSNGYDETLFARVMTPKPAAQPGIVRLLHSGTIYPSERDPQQFFEALLLLKQHRPELAARLRVILRSSGHDALFQPVIDKLDINAIVTLAPALNYVEALQEMLSVDALLLMQASNCNYQTPAKAYEYIRAMRPILALTDETGDTAQLVRQTGMAEIAPLNSTEQIFKALIILLEKLANQAYYPLDEKQIRAYSRQQQAETLRQLVMQL